ncbi:cobyrinate a,c-diamide synthase [Clostridium sp. AF19-22AC]|jgi:cobyrinic acid a,c-diamide synthase|uniref:cobyrinate a,c-diamide synthase n=1 Tax=Clostridia TaxID=186801 RepID=UPI000E536B00|nr:MULTISPECIES: cobyrinate a,c-diamide synthase [Clostridia]RHR27048.1 cobyrinate a,c-diamide synthase [Clostridium sp. AF19-22AC]
MKGSQFMIAAASSGSGKTVISCALMAAFLQRGMKTAACKCGPDYIDPMFHREVLGIESENLDLFFCEPEVLKPLFLEHTRGAEVTVIEGVMGYYDGMALDSDQASSFHVAGTLGIPVVLVVPCRGMALSVLPMILGMLQFREESHIQGILLNRISGMLYPKMKAMIEAGLKEKGYQIPVVGYVPEDEVFGLESRHLGLVTPKEVLGIRERLMRAGEILSGTVDLEQLLEIGRNEGNADTEAAGQAREVQTGKKARIGIARDEAFCFYYKDNLELLKNAGCELIPFSPLHDSRLPEGLQGMIIGGGYPELYTETLSANGEMCTAVREAVEEGMPCLAECGGFMYLHEEMEGKDGVFRSVAGVIEGRAVKKDRLVRFGYIDLQAQKDGIYFKKGERLRGHEFHYWDSTDNGTDCLAVKPDKKRFWECIHMEGSLFAGYPHIHFYSNPVFAERFIENCRKFQSE